MSPYPRGERNTRLECDCGAPVVKDDDEYVCVGCGETVSEEETEDGNGDSPKRADPLP
jgi:uncharacterized Zn finger protein (UPF0148 family)